MRSPQCWMTTRAWVEAMSQPTTRCTLDNSEGMPWSAVLDQDILHHCLLRGFGSLAGEVRAASLQTSVFAQDQPLEDLLRTLGIHQNVFHAR